MNKNKFLEHAQIDVPVICGAMYPCSNPELIAAVSEAGGLGIIQPISMEYVHGHKLRAGIQLIRERTTRPIGLNILVESSLKVYRERMEGYIETALEEGVRFFITALGNPSWVIQKVRAYDGIVYHDVTNAKWAGRAVAYGVDGLICVNQRAGGHAGTESPEELFEQLRGFNLPLICAGGIGDEQGFAKAIQTGYSGVQLGTRFIATTECNAHEDYKIAILKASASDIVLSEKITGVPVSVIKTPYIEAMGLRSGPLVRWLLRNRRTKHLTRMFFSLKSVWQLKRSLQLGSSYRDYWQAGKSVESINQIESASEIVNHFATTWKNL